jgi:hypothetical protein
MSLSLPPPLSLVAARRQDRGVGTQGLFIRYADRIPATAQPHIRVLCSPSCSRTHAQIADGRGAALSAGQRRLGALVPPAAGQAQQSRSHAAAPASASARAPVRSNAAAPPRREAAANAPKPTHDRPETFPAVSPALRATPSSPHTWRSQRGVSFVSRRGGTHWRAGLAQQLHVSHSQPRRAGSAGHALVRNPGRPHREPPPPKPPHLVPRAPPRHPRFLRRRGHGSQLSPEDQTAAEDDAIENRFAGTASLHAFNTHTHTHTHPHLHWAHCPPFPPQG